MTTTDRGIPRPFVPHRAAPIQVEFIDRPNRYVARVRTLGSRRTFSAHVPNPGRMGELLVGGETVGWVVAAHGPGRKTGFDLIAVQHRGSWVSVDSRVANQLVRQAVGTAWLPEFGSGPWRSEVPFGESRIDFGTAGEGVGPSALLEVKSSNLRVGDTAMFPDAPTVRGTRHLEELTRAAGAGIRAGVLFMIQHQRARRFVPNSALDPQFAGALAAAAEAGVTIAARSMRTDRRGAHWGQAVPVDLDGSREVG